MGIAKRNKRKLLRNDRVFFWFVREESDYGGALVVTILSEDKRFGVQFELAQSEQSRHLTVMNEEFGFGRWEGRYRRYRCPDWCSDGLVTPKSVREIIEWSLSPDERLPI